VGIYKKDYKPGGNSMVACIIPMILGAFFQQEMSCIKRIMQHRLLQEETRIEKQEMQFQSCEGARVLL